MATPPAATSTSVLFVAIVQAATTFLRNALADELDLPVTRRLSGGTWNTTELVDGVALGQMSTSPSIAYTHAHPLPFNVRTISAALDRAVLNLRDPRQVVVSVVHFIDTVVAEYPVYYAAHGLPDGYLDLDLGDRIDHHLEHTYPMLVGWIDGWLQVADDPEGVRLLVVQHAELKADRHAFFRKIYEFYGLDPSAHGVPDDRGVPGRDFFRQGRSDEWRTVLSPVQTGYVNELVRAAWWDRFGWRP